MKPGAILREALLGTAIGMGIGPESSFTEETRAYVGALFGQPDAEAEVAAHAQAEAPAPPAGSFHAINRETRRYLGLKNDAASKEHGGVWTDTASTTELTLPHQLELAAEGLKAVHKERAKWRR
jgi:hypothetical protein